MDFMDENGLFSVQLVQYVHFCPIPSIIVEYSCCIAYDVVL